MNSERNIFLFSVDLEDVRLGIPGGEKYKERVPELIKKYLEFLRRYDSTCTFFVVGVMAEKYPSLIKLIIDEGHEIGCHTYEHILPLDKMTPMTFKNDLEKNVEALYKAGAKEVSGFRAPTFSLTEKTKWAYGILEKLDFKYSSSVLPAKNPLYGWENFGYTPQKIGNILEIPISVTGNRYVNIPFGGGIYFRVLPRFIIDYYFKKSTKSDFPVSGYFHPYDIDIEQEKFMHPGINNSIFYNYLMYYGRRRVLNKISSVLQKGYKIIKYNEYLMKMEKQ